MVGGGSIWIFSLIQSIFLKEIQRTKLPVSLLTKSLMPRQEDWYHPHPYQPLGCCSHLLRRWGITSLPSEGQRSVLQVPRTRNGYSIKKRSHLAHNVQESWWHYSGTQRLTAWLSLMKSTFSIPKPQEYVLLGGVTCNLLTDTKACASYTAKT